MVPKWIVMDPEKTKDPTDTSDTCLVFKNQNNILCTPTLPAAEIGYNPASGILVFKKALRDMVATNPNTARIVLYVVNSENWAGIGANPNGMVWIKTGTDAETVRQYLFTTGGSLNVPVAVSFGTTYAQIVTHDSGKNLWIETSNVINIRGLNNVGWKTIQAAAFTIQSSSRYKKNISPMTEEEACKILEINPVTFDYKEEIDGTNCRGVIAEEVYDTIPFVVQMKDGEPDSVDYSKFVPYLIKMIQIQQKEIQQLKQIVST